MIGDTHSAPDPFNMAQYCLAQSAAQTPDKTALIVVSDAATSLAEAEHWTYRQLDHTVRSIAAGLRAAGLTTGARLLLRLGNTSDNALMYFGAIAAGYVPIPASAMLTTEEVQFLLADSGASMIASNDQQDLAAQFTVAIWDKARIEQLKQFPPGDYATTRAEDPAFLVYTSGTTNKPKGVLHAHRSVWGRRPMYQGWYGLQASDIMLHAGALNWTYTLGVGLSDPWAMGATTVVYNGPKDIHAWPVLIEKVSATLFAAVPSLYRQLLKYTDVSAFNWRALRHGLTAGEALHPDLLTQWQSVTGKNLYEALGMSECSTFVSTHPGMPVRSGSPGKPQAGRRIAILPIEGAADPLLPNNIGLLAIHRSDPGLMLGYWQRPEEEAQAYRGDWFVGGDLASMDEEGYLYYHGRHDDIMNCMGYRVSPMEVESCLIQHPEVAEVAVTELKISTDVSVIGAFIVARHGEYRDKDSVIAFAHAHLAAYKCPREVVFLTSLPRTANGKVQRKQLQAILATGNLCAIDGAMD